MNDRIGESAGAVWNWLDRHEDVTVSSLVKGTGLKQREVDRAIGWLARENKITIQKNANKELLSLVREEVSA